MRAVVLYSLIRRIRAFYSLFYSIRPLISAFCPEKFLFGTKNAPRAEFTIATFRRINKHAPGADIYRHRWTIEIFIPFFKHILGCRHLLSQDPVGIEMQTYMAITARMLISLWSGRKPTLRSYEMICFYFTGLADEEEVISHVKKLQPHDV